MRVLGLLSLNKSYLLVWSAFQLGKVEVKHTVLRSKSKREGLDFISITFRSTLRLLTQTTGPTGIFHLKNRHLDKICTQYQHSANFEHLCRESHTHISCPNFSSCWQPFRWTRPHVIAIGARGALCSKIRSPRSLSSGPNRAKHA